MSAHSGKSRSPLSQHRVMLKDKNKAIDTSLPTVSAKLEQEVQEAFIMLKDAIRFMRTMHNIDLPDMIERLVSKRW